MRKIFGAAIFVVFSGAASADITVTFGGDWDGVTVPDGQQCHLHGGNGATPPISLTGLPDGAAVVVLEFNDKSYRPLSENGGHGAIAFDVTGMSAELPAVPELSDELGDGIRVQHAARSSGNYASPGYLAPCSGGQGNRYTVDIIVKNAIGAPLETLTDIDIGRY